MGVGELLLNAVRTTIILSKCALKKLDDRAVKWFRNRARDQRKKVLRVLRSNFDPSRTGHQYRSERVQIWRGGKPEDAICEGRPTPVPSVLCLNVEPDVTTTFLQTLRTRLFSAFEKGGTDFVRRKKPNGLARISGYLDFSQLSEISLGAAVVLTADYDRMSRLISQIPPTIDLHRWQDAVVTRLYEIGFFQILGHIPSSDKLIKGGPTLTMPIICGKNADELRTVDESLQALGKHLTSSHSSVMDETLVKVLTTISEAITNVTQHAYTSHHQYQYEHVDRFWVAATADRTDQTLTVAVYDQGATIPVTYPRLDLKSKAIRFLRSAISKPAETVHQHDGTYIRTAMRYGGSRTDQDFRGKGLPQMFKLMQSIGYGSMSIRSRGGWCTRLANGRMSQGFVEQSIGGTLVEWSIAFGDIGFGELDDD